MGLSLALFTCLYWGAGIAAFAITIVYHLAEARRWTLGTTIGDYLDAVLTFGKTRTCRSPFDVPKRWFWQFYAVGLAASVTLLAVLLDSRLRFIHIVKIVHMDTASGSFPIFETDCLITDSTANSVLSHTNTVWLVLFITLQTARRLWECLYVNANDRSDAVIHPLHYLVGLSFYPAVLGTIYVSSSFCIDATDAPLPFAALGSTSVLSLLTASLSLSGTPVLAVVCAIYTVLAYEQYRCARILANLRRVEGRILTDKDPHYSVQRSPSPTKRLRQWVSGRKASVDDDGGGNRKDGSVSIAIYAVPQGRLFRYVACPHYFCEVAIYALFWAAFGRHSLGLVMIAVFVGLNQLASAIDALRWYQRTFDKKQLPSQWKALIPFVI
eukprot:Clim_evm3s169 gene=Clim_evmTU3s169